MIFYIVGMSCSGKDMVVKNLNIPQIPSITTRPARKTDRNMKYIGKEDVGNLDFVEYSEYCGNMYGTLRSDFNTEVDSFKIIEPKGLAMLKLIPHPHKVIYVHTPVSECKRRMLKRDGKVDETRFVQEVKDLFREVWRKSDLLIAGTDEGGEELVEYVQRFLKSSAGEEDLFQYPQYFLNSFIEGDSYEVHRHFTDGKTSISNEILTKVVKRRDGRLHLVFDPKKPGTFFPFGKSPYGIREIRSFRDE